MTKYLYNRAMFKIEPATIAWLMEGDPSIRWQVQRDLLDEKPAVYQKERAKTATEGWGARLLEKQDKKGTWANGLYVPKWTSTHYTLLTLRFLGLPATNAHALKGCAVLLESGFLPDHGINYSPTAEHAETCITGMALSIFSHFRVDDPRVDQIAEHLLGHEMKDGGWNCRSLKTDMHSSFNTSLLVLEGLREYQNFRPKNKLPIAAALEAGREFFLQHHLYKSHRTGRIVKQSFLLTPSQPTWQYDFLRALDHFQFARAPRDKRLEDAIGVLVSKRDKNSLWPQNRPATGKTFFAMETVSQPSRWNTLRALRVLRWWER